MNVKKLTSLFTVIALLVTTAMSSSVNAASPVASMSLSGASNTTGTFSVVVYENTGSEKVTTANVALDFSSNVVSQINYDYHVGPFKNCYPNNGGCAAFGEVSGSQPVAIVSFTINNPSTVTATISPISYLERAVRDSSGQVTGATERFAITRGSATFTYSDPGRGNQGTPSQPSPSSTPTGGSTKPTSGASTPKQSTQNNLTTTNSDPVAVSTPTNSESATTTPEKKDSEVKAAEATNSASPRKDSKSTNDNTIWKLGALFVLLALAAALYVLQRKRGFMVTEGSAVAATKVAKKTSSKKTSKKPA